LTFEVRTAGWRVAVLDDDADLVLALAAALGRSGFEAAQFGTVESLLQACDDMSFDAFVIDWQLADCTTQELVETLRKRVRSAQVPIFLLSGQTAIGGIPCDAAMRAAITAYRLIYRAKPFSARRLAHELVAALGHRQVA
jgi:DNA-binding response OmpR family regulator